MIRTLLIASSILVLAGCATRYQSSGLTGGHGELAAPGKLQKVFFSGNGFTSAELAQKYALYRCAELAKQNKKPFFIIYKSLTNAARGIPTDIPNVGKVDNKPVAVSFILMLDAPRVGGHETDAVLKELQPIIDSASTTPT